MKDNKKILLVKLCKKDCDISPRRNSSIFKTFLSETLYEQTRHQIKKIDYQKSIEDLLIDELQKPIKSKTTKKRLNLFEPQSPINTMKSHSQRNIEQLKNFMKFVRFNNIQLDDLKKISSLLQYQFCPKNTYLYQTMDRSKRFYGIIKGKVVITKKITINHPPDPRKTIEPKDKDDDAFLSIDNFITHDSSIDTNKYDDNNEENEEYDDNTSYPNSTQIFKSKFEAEHKRLYQGMCFGEWEMMHNSIYTSSGFCIEDTHFFYLSKDAFDNVLYEILYRSNTDSKMFIHQCVPLLSDEDLKNIQPEFYDKGAIIYTQFTQAKHAFIIYQGECVLKHDSYAKNIEEIYEKKRQTNVITIVSKGGVVGLEAGLTNNKFYENNLEVSTNYTVIYRLNVKELNMKIDFKAFLSNLYETKQKLLTSNLYSYHNPLQLKLKTEEIKKKDEFEMKIKSIIYNPRNKINENKVKAYCTKTSKSKLNLFNKDVKKLKNGKVRTSISPLSFKEYSIRDYSFIQRGDKMSSSFNCTRTCFYSNNNDLLDKRMSSQPSQIITQVQTPAQRKKTKMKIIPNLSFINKDLKKRNIRIDQIIIDTLKQHSKFSEKNTAYDSGCFNIPLFHSNIRPFSQ